MRINSIKFNNVYSYKPSFKSKPNDKPSPNFNEIPDVIVPYEVLKQMKMMELRKSPIFEDILNYGNMEQAACEVGDIEGQIKAKAEIILLSLQYETEGSDYNLPERLKDSVFDVFYNDRKTASQFIDITTALNYASIDLLEDALRAFNSKKDLSPVDMATKSQIEKKMLELNEQKAKLKEYLLQNHSDEMKYYADKFTDKKNYSFYKAIILGRNSNPLDIAKIFSDYCTELSQRQIVKKYDNSCVYYYRAHNDRNEGLGLYLRVENKTGKIMEFMMVNSPLQVISGLFTPEGQLMDVTLEDRRNFEISTLKPDYEKNILSFDRLSPKGATTKRYNINQDGTFSPLEK